MTHVPFIPSTAPFTPEQRAWLNGYFVGLLSTAHAPDATALLTETSPPRPLLILYGSQTGGAEQIAKRAAKEAVTHGFTTRAAELNSLPPADLAQHERLLIITSTWGDGEPPDNAADFWNALHSDAAPRLEHLHYSVLALGDRNYADFCGAGRKLDERLHTLGAQRVIPRSDCDVDYEATAREWFEKIWPALASSGSDNPIVPNTETTPVEPSPTAPAAPSSQWHRSNPFPARLLTNRLLNGVGSTKETRHFEISLEGSDLSYVPGDALGVWPENCPELVAEIIDTAGWRPEDRVTAPDGQETALMVALLRKCDIRKPSSALLDALGKTPGCAAFTALLTPDLKPRRDQFLGEREVIDLLLEFPKFRPSPAEFVNLLGKIQPRLYSISSSPRAFPGQVHLTVGIVRYETRARQRRGLCSTFLSDRVASGGTVPVFIQTSPGFRLPADPATPVIMVGPGTGIAPFRAFLHERRATAAPGKNWLFFGDQQHACDYLYREEIEQFCSDRLLTHCHTAFSRDQSEKIYVQHRLLENASEIWRWLEEGAHFYVCGDAKRMARDVDAALHQVIEKAGRSPEQAAEYVRHLKTQKRYQRDVY